MDTVIRHFFSFTEAKGFGVEKISDDLLIKFLTTEMPTTNKGSIGRILNGIRYVSATISFRMACHSGEETTRIYARATDEMKRQAQRVGMYFYIFYSCVILN